MESFYSVASFCGTKLICCLHVSKKAEPVHSGTSQTFKIKLSVETDLDQKPTYQDSYQECVGIFHCALLCTSYLLNSEFQAQKALNLQVNLPLY